MRTIVDMDVWPERLALTDHACLLAGKRGLDEERNLDGVRVRDTGVKERALRDAVDGGRKDDMRADVTLLVSLYDGQVDVAVEGRGRDGLDLLDVEVRVDGLGDVHAPSVVREDACARLNIHVRLCTARIDDTILQCE